MSSLAAGDHPEAPLFSDGVGDRVVAVDGATGELLQILRLRPALIAVPSFEFALRERAARLANFRHGYYARVRRVDRGMAPGSALSLVSDHVEGTRLSDILRVAHERGLQLDLNAALCLIRQLVPAVAVLHENARDVAHGLIAPERLIVTANARIVIVEHVLGAAIEQLQFGRDRLWQEFRIAMPPSAGLPRFDHRADVTGMGLVALALVLGRPVAADEYPHHIPKLLNEAREHSAVGDKQPLSLALRSWLSRALQVDVRRAFASAPEAMMALEEIVADDSMYIAAPMALETFLGRYSDSLLEPAISARPPAARPPAASWVQEPEAPEAPVSSWTREVEPPVSAWAREFDSPVQSRTQAFDPPPTSRSQAFEPSTRLEREPASFSIDDFADFAETPAFEQPPVDSWDEVQSPAPFAASGFVASARDITDLLGPEPLPVPVSVPVEVRRTAPKPLFDPDEPFSVAPFTAAAFTADPLALPVKPKGSRARLFAAVAIVLALAGGAVLGLWYGASADDPAMGTLVVQSNPAGVEVFVDGVQHGRTPARISLASGSHILELRGSGVPRVIPLTVSPGAEVSQYLEFADVANTGQLALKSDPAGAKVLIDGIERGIAPLTVTNLAPGDHQVEFQSEGLSARHTVNVQAGATASLTMPIGTAGGGTASGWVSVKAPFTLEIHEQGRLLGSSDDRLMLTPGRHELELVSETLGYRATRVVNVVSGKRASIVVDLPQGVVHLNASPWAEVWIDGERVGDTPIGNLSVTIGPHEIVFKHPELGEKRQAVSVTLGTPVRLSIDMK
jgi:serine/threonine protein kinase